MGNAPDKTIDKVFMSQTSSLMQHFSREQALFHSQEIQFPLSTDGMKIVDKKGNRVKLAGGNWSGGHMCRHCVDGLECRNMRDIAMHIRFKFKMNVIRLTYSLQLILDNDVIPQKYLKANPQLIGKTSMQIFDITIKTLTDVGLMVILNNHTSTSQWCCSNDDGDGLWWSRQYPQYQFFQHVQNFAKRYRDNPLVIGMDLRNQIRKANGIEPTWGDGNPRTDWKRAAEISAELALKYAPHWLILIGGINYQLDLSGVKQNPIKLSIPNKLVYTGHFYGFSWPIPSWNVYSYDNFKKRFFNSQTYVRTLGVPYLLGEFGNNNQDIPWKYLMRFMKQTDIDWTYWALDGFKCDRQKDETYGVFTNDFSGARHPEMLQDLIKNGPPPKAMISYSKYEQRLLNRKKENVNKNEEQKIEKLGQRRINKNEQNFIDKKKKYFEQKNENVTQEIQIEKFQVLGSLPDKNKKLGEDKKNKQLDYQQFNMYSQNNHRNYQVNQGQGQGQESWKGNQVQYQQNQNDLNRLANQSKQSQQNQGNSLSNEQSVNKNKNSPGSFIL